MFRVGGGGGGEHGVSCMLYLWWHFKILQGDVLAFAAQLWHRARDQFTLRMGNLPLGRGGQVKGGDQAPLGCITEQVF